MLQSFNHLAQALFGKDSFTELSISELEKFSNQYPYVAATRIMLARKLRDDGQPSQEAAATASLYIHNPLWLHWLLHPEQSFNQANNQFPVTISRPVEDPEPNQSAYEHEEPVEELDTISPFNEAESTENPETEPPLKIQETLQEAAQSINSPDQTSEVPLAFEPYHTIDYFASQGIKLKPEDLEEDKFGRQLKSFTEWLRSMKRPGAAENREVVDEIAQASIKSFAEHSVEGGDIATETMAEVWLKQGNPARALAIYEKLSLLNPSKSHYFAAKIEQLKNSGL